LGTDYLVIEEAPGVPALGLLASLCCSRPDHLDLPMYLRLPDAQLDGAIWQLTPRGGYILRYRIRRCTGREARRATGPA
jgi:hypothetical protein